MHVRCSKIRSAMSVAAALVTIVSMLSGPRPALAVTIKITLTERADETLEGGLPQSPAGIDQVPMGDYTATGEVGEKGDSLTVDLVNGQKAITKFFSDPNTDNSPADTNFIFIGGTPLNPTVEIDIKSPKEGLGVVEVPEPRSLVLLGFGLASLAAIRLRRRVFG